MERSRKTRRPGIFRLLRAALVLRCPRCARGALFDGFFRMRSACVACGLRFEREQGFFVGAIYVNYTATVLLAVGGFFLLDHYAGISLYSQLVLWCAFAGVFPILFFRHSRSFWLCVACFFDPDEERLRAVIK